MKNDEIAVQTSGILIFYFESGLFESGLFESGLFESGLFESGLFESGLFAIHNCGAAYHGGGDIIGVSYPERR